ncbi:MAG: hypothetical protein R3242_01485 [Akkermansiaceae bacterium]|nr:hypothetical protein [Akkermansiaceae bacterium]
MESTESKLGAFFEKAYWMQRGEYYPETHAKNIDELSQQFPWDRELIDTLYRLLPHFDFVAEEAVKKFKLGEKTNEEAYQDLCYPIFSRIPESVKKDVWDLHLSSAELNGEP